jgi:hypothetical protein
LDHPKYLTDDSLKIALKQDTNGGKFENCCIRKEKGELEMAAE